MSDFNTSVFGCLNDIVVCIIVFFVPCYQGGVNKARVDERDCHFCDCCCWGPQIEYYTRQQLRSKYGYSNDEIMDALLVCFCTQCVVCQHHNEMASHGK